MKQEYVPVLEALGLPPEAGGLLTGKIRLPKAWLVEQPPKSPPVFPPASIPILAHNGGVFGQSMVMLWGVWAHWFTPGRSLTFASTKMELGSGVFVREYARSFEQFALRLLALRDGPGDKAARDTAQALGIPWDRVPALTMHRFSDSERDDAELEGEDLADLEEDEDRPAATLYLEADYVDDYAPMRTHPAFAGNLPLGLVETHHRPGVGLVAEGYEGDWPHGFATRDREALRRTCGYEFGLGVGDLEDSAGKPWEAVIPLLPPWLPDGREQAPIFDALLGAGDFQGAWMSLNTSGWLVEDARAAILRLADAAADPAFRLLAETWTTQKFDEGGY